MHKIVTLFLLLMAAAAALVPSDALAAEQRTVIRFADLGGIKGWQVARDGALLIEGRRDAWYRATFWGPCVELRFAMAQIAFVTEPTGDLDKFSSIIVGGERCWFKTFEPIAAPSGNVGD